MRSLIWIGMMVGSSLGGFVPVLWGSDPMSLAGVACGVVGGVVGIWAGYRLSTWV